MENLYPHNQKAVDAVKAHFAAGNRKAAVVHATGTGKSYIIAAVAQDYQRVLVIAPNNFVLDETRKVCHAGCEFRTYASVMYNEGERGKYDIIVLDEFHRGGAEKWGEGVKQLIEANPQALLLGTSATHIRYLDNQRNMADELFDGQVVSYLPLKDAIDQKILPTPTYVSSIYTMEDTIRTREKRINNSKKCEAEKEDLCRRLKNISHNWENAGGVPSIIRKYFTHDMQRVIVFCSQVKRAAEAKQMFSEWFGLAGFRKVRYYNIDYTEKHLDIEMRDFQEPLGEYDLKVAISVNMLNEGVHIPHVDGVIMLRSTMSRIIIEQQVGRCLTSNNAETTPVILDLVNNIDNTIFRAPAPYGTQGERLAETNRTHEDNDFPFSIIDECLDIRDVLSRLDIEIGQRSWTREVLAEIAKKYSRPIDWEKNDKNSYSAAIRKPYYNEITAHMLKKKREWTREELSEIAKHYNRPSEWEKNDVTSYTIALRKPYYKEITAHMAKLKREWTREELSEIAKRYNRPSEWKKTECSSYNAAKRKPYYNEITAHMKRLW